MCRYDVFSLKKNSHISEKIPFGKENRVDIRVYPFSLFRKGLKCNLAKHSREYSNYAYISNGSSFELKL